MILQRRFIVAVFLLFLLPIVCFCQPYEVEFQHNVMIPMRDGTQLAANIFMPKAEPPFPVILIRSPYGKGDGNQRDGHFYGEKGYVVVIQDTRGKGDSEGEWEPFKHEGQDGFDTQEWIGTQAWCDGNIGTMGGSYLGYTQWISAPYRSKYLKAMIPEVPFGETYDLMYIGGAYQLALTFNWGTVVSPNVTNPFQANLQEGLKRLPLLAWNEYVGAEIPYITGWLSNPVYNDYWKERGIGDGYKDIGVPILNIGGWYDIFAKDTLEITNRVRHESENRMARRNQFVIMGPWHHGGSERGKVGELDFGEVSDLQRRPIRLKWFDYWLKGVESGVEDWTPFYIFVMGKNEWRGENEWPPSRTQWTNYYIHSNGSANSSGGDGTLSATPPLDEPADTFVYDPDDPAPTVGGNHLGYPAPGPYDQAEVEKRSDVLVYTTEPLEEDVEVTGPVKMTLFAASTATDTDFTAKLVDVHPDGKAYNLCDGIIRARYREPEAGESPIEPGAAYRYEIDLWVTSNVFLKGHRIRVEVSSSNFPRFDRNPNSGKPFASDTELFDATQTIYHDAERPSHIVLPIMPVK